MAQAVWFDADMCTAFGAVLFRLSVESRQRFESRFVMAN